MISAKSAWFELRQLSGWETAWYESCHLHLQRWPAKPLGHFSTNGPIPVQYETQYSKWKSKRLCEQRVAIHTLNIKSWHRYRLSKDLERSEAHFTLEFFCRCTFYSPLVALWVLTEYTVKTKLLFSGVIAWFGRENKTGVVNTLIIFCQAKPMSNHVIQKVSKKAFHWWGWT